MKKGWSGLESAGKSQLMAVEAFKVYKRNKKWLKIREKRKIILEKFTYTNKNKPSKQNP